MELRDYLAALRRYWTTWVGVTLLGVAVALVTVLSVSPTYQAEASVFVSAASMEGTSGAQFIKQRVTSYPDVARSEAVLGPVIEDLGLTVTVSQLRTRVSADNPLDSSQIDITVIDDDPIQAASIANAVADEFRTTVEQLERPSDGETPVSLTVTDPANVPGSPVAPQPVLLLGLGLLVGLLLGVAVAVIRSRTDTALHTEDDVRDAWGPGADELAVLSPSRSRRGDHLLSGRPASLVARRLATPVGSMPVRAVVLGVGPGADHGLARSFADKVAHELIEGGVAATVTGPVNGPARAAKPLEVQLATATPRVPLSEWRAIGDRYDGVVLVAESGRVHGADLREIRAILASTSARLLAVVLLPRGRTRPGSARRNSPRAPETRAGANLVRTRERIALEKG